MLKHVMPRKTCFFRHVKTCLKHVLTCLFSPGLSHHLSFGTIPIYAMEQWKDSLTPSKFVFREGLQLEI